MERYFHRIGGGSVDNLRLKPREERLRQPGISVIEAKTAQEAAQRIRQAFPKAMELHEAGKTVGSTTETQIIDAGFAIIAAPTRNLPGHHRIIHPEGLPGFTEANLKKLSEAFRKTKITTSRFGRHQYGRCS